MKKYLKLAFALLLSSNTLHAQWQTSFKDSLTYFASNVFFINNDTGFVSMGLNGSPFHGVIFRTIDGGLSWDTTHTTYLIYALNFINDSVGFAAGQDELIYKTNDMGMTWNYQSGACTCDDIFSIHFLNNDTGFFASGVSFIRNSYNGGNSWQYIFSSLGNGDYPGKSRMFFIDSLTGFVVQSTITKTIDRGITWFNLNIPSNLNAYSASFTDSLHGTAVGDNGKVSQTSDGGVTWSVADSLGPYPLYDVHFVNDSIGYIIGGRDGRNYANANGVIFKTINGGISWHLMDSSYFDALLKFHFPSDSIGYAVGFNGLILKISNANSLFTSVSNLVYPKEDIMIHPNPATSKITITIKHPSPVIILNSIGTVIFSGVVEKGLTEFDVTLFPSGLYLISIGNTTQKFVKQ